MARHLLTASGLGSPSAAPFVADLTAVLAPVLDKVISSVQLDVTEKLPSNIRQFQAVIEYEDGGATQSAPYVPVVIEAAGEADLKQLVDAFYAANAAKFITPIQYAYTDQLPNIATRYLAIFLTCTDATDGAANYQVGGGGGGTGGVVPGGNVLGDLLYSTGPLPTDIVWLGMGAPGEFLQATALGLIYTTVDASDIGYTPAVPADWNPAPTDVDGALDQLAASRVRKSGDTMTGLLNTAAATLLTAGLNLGVGVAPTAPVNADVWATTAGAFVRVNGTTYDMTAPSRVAAGLATGLLKVTTGTGALSTAVAGTDYVAPGAITSSGLTLPSGFLVGRASVGTGTVEQITVGSGLSLSPAGTLTATGGVGTITGSGTIGKVPLWSGTTALGDSALTEASTSITSSKELITVASVLANAGLNIPHGTAPTAPVNGDLWSTSAGFFGRVNGVTVGPFAAGGGGVTGSGTTGVIPLWSGTTALGDSSISEDATKVSISLKQLVVVASNTTRAGLLMTPGVAPTTPVDGEVWGTTGGFFTRISSTTYDFTAPVRINPALATGLVKVTTGTGTLSTATAGTDYVAPGAVTTSGLTMATARLLGRSTASPGAIEEITVSTGLSLSAGVLTATGTGGTVTGSGTTGKIPVWSGTTALGDSALTEAATTITSSKELITVASTTTNAGFNLPNGAAPTTPVAGDVWSTASGLFYYDSAARKIVFNAGGAANQVAFFTDASNIDSATNWALDSTKFNQTFTQAVAASGTGSMMTFTAAASTAQTAGTEIIDFNVNLGRTLQFATGAIATQRAMVIQAPTYGFVGASVITSAATLAITGAPVTGTNASITSSYALWIQAGKLATAATATTGAGLMLPHGTAPSSPVNGDLWTTTTGLFARINGVTVGPYSTGSGTTTGTGTTNKIALWSSTTALGNSALTEATNTITSTKGLVLPASSSTIAPLRIGDNTGAAPSAPADGDMWSTSSGLFYRIAAQNMGVALTGLNNTFTVDQALTGNTNGTVSFNMYNASTGTSALAQWTTSCGIGNRYARMIMYCNNYTATNLFGVTPTDWAAFIGTGGGLAGVAYGSQDADCNIRMGSGAGVLTIWTSGGLTVGQMNVLYSKAASSSTDAGTTFAGGIGVAKTSVFAGLLITVASATGGAGFNMPHGAAPSSPTNGDLWTTTAGLFARINGATVAYGAGTVTGSGAANSLAVWTSTTAVGTVANLTASTAAVSYTQAAQSSGVNVAFTIVGGAHTNLTASTEVIGFNVNLAQTVQHATGALATQRAMVVQAPTYSFVAASVITSAATLAITGAPVTGTNATITSAYALWIQAGKLGTAATATTGAGLNLPHGTAPSSPVNGDLWTTTAGFFGHVNGVTANLISGSGTAGTIVQSTASSVIAAASGLTWATTALVWAQAAATSGAPTALTVTGAAHTGQSATNETSDVIFNLARTVTHATGAIASLRAVRIAPPTHAFVGASVVTSASTLYIGGAPAAGTNGSITYPVALLIAAGATQFNDAEANSSTVFTAATNGGSLAMPRTTRTSVMAPAAPIATFTLTMPATAFDGQEVTVTSDGNHAITTLTHQGAGADQVLEPLTTITISTFGTWRYRQNLGVWLRVG